MISTNETSLAYPRQHDKVPNEGKAKRCEVIPRDLEVRSDKERDVA